MITKITKLTKENISSLILCQDFDDMIKKGLTGSIVIGEATDDVPAIYYKDLGEEGQLNFVKESDLIKFNASGEEGESVDISDLELAQSFMSLYLSNLFPQVWVPKKIADVQKINEGDITPADIASEDRDFFIQRRYPNLDEVSFKILVENCYERINAGFGIYGGGVILDLTNSSPVSDIPQNTYSILRQLANNSDVIIKVPDLAFKKATEAELTKFMDIIKYTPEE